jgi:hypothetical protein
MNKMLVCLVDVTDASDEKEVFITINRGVKPVVSSEKKLPRFLVSLFPYIFPKGKLLSYITKFMVA